MERPPAIALLTDFGRHDFYVAAMHGEILRRLPDARVIDITHDVPPQDIAGAVFQLECVLPSLPRGTVLCAVVDPGVGTARRAMCGRIGPWTFVGPDNGLATALLERAEDAALYAIEAPEFRNPEPSVTFHGRDLFAPAAAHLAAGAPVGQAGPPIGDPVRLSIERCRVTPSGVRTEVAWIDRFGNAITWLRREEARRHLAGGIAAIRAAGTPVVTLGRTFADVAPGEPVAYWGSAGTLEIAVNQGSAARRLSLAAGAAVELDGT